MLPFHVFIYTEPRSVHSKPRPKSSAAPESVGLHPAVLSPPIALSLSNAFLFMDFRTLCAQRSTATPLQSTVYTLFPFQRRGRKYCGSFQSPFQPACQCPLLPLCFQQLPTIKLNYPTRIVHPERSEGSLCEREVGSQPNPFRLYCLQQLTTIKSSNSLVLKTIRIARGVWGARLLRYGPGAWLTKQTGRIPDTVS